MPDKEWLIGLAIESKRECREQLYQMIDAAINELLQAGWEPRTIADALVELADDYMDNVIGGIAMNSPSTRLH